MVFETYKRPYTMSAEPLPQISTTTPLSRFDANNHSDWRNEGRSRLSLGSVHSFGWERRRQSMAWNDHRYVASSTRLGRGLDMDALERRKREREMAQRYRNGNISSGERTGEWSTSNHSSFKARITRAPSTRQYGSSFLPQTAKQIYFVLNGQPSQIYRTLLNPTRLHDFDILLEEVSRGLEIAIYRLYTYDGEMIGSVDQLFDLKDNRVLAVPRNERLLLHGRSYSDINGPTASADKFQSGLPPIRKPARDSSGSSSGQIVTTARRYADRRYNPIQHQGNSIERPLKQANATIALPPNASRKRYVASLMNRQQKSTNDSSQLSMLTHTVASGIVAANATQLTQRKRLDEKREFPKLAQKREQSMGPIEGQTRLNNKRQDRRKRLPAAPQMSEAMQAELAKSKAAESKRPVTADRTGTMPASNARHSNSNTADSDSGRPRSSNDFSNGGATTATPFHPDDFEEDVDEEELEGDDELEEQDSADDYPQQPDALLEAEMEADKQEMDEDVKTGRSVEKDSEENAKDYGLAEEQAVIKIQAATRGFLARKKYKVVKFQLNGREPSHHKVRSGTPIPQRKSSVKSGKSDEEEQERELLKSQGSVRSQGSERSKKSRKSQGSARSQRSVRSQRSRKSQESARSQRSLKSQGKEQSDEEHSVTKREVANEEINDQEDIENQELNPEAIEADVTIEDKEPETVDDNVEDLEVKPEEDLLIEEPETSELLQKDENDEIEKEEMEVEDPEKVPQTESADSTEDEDEDEVLARRTKGPNDVNSYSVTVKLGNRWAADSETELYISMIGDKKESAKFYMRQKYVNWLESEQLNYVQQASDTFQMQIECGFLGIIRRLVIGHDSPGYGAGIFIDRIIITEDAINGRAYLFQCHKWLDSGQVDGKLERILRLTAYCDMDPIPHAMERVTHGRWEVVLHSGDQKGNGGTSSNLRLVGFGTRGSAEMIIQNEAELRQVPSKTLMQCHFKGIGELLKLRVEVDGAGETPDYFLEQVELRDLDTQDRCVVQCGKWLRWQSSRKNDQPFREFLTFRLGAEPLPLISYDAKLRISPPQFKCIEPLIKLELVGDIGETGVVLLDLEQATEKAGKLELPFKIEAVSIGKLNTARLYMDPTDIGEQIFEGFSALQTIWDKRSNDMVLTQPMSTTGNDWLTGTLFIREGPHTPYRYVLNSARVRPRLSNEEPFIKELKRSALEGMSTRVSKKKSTNDHSTPSWLLSMCLGEDSRLLPLVYLCGTKDTAQMTPISNAATDNLLSYQLRDSDLGNICKVRLKTEDKSRLMIAEDKELELKDGQPVVFIRKMRLSDGVNGDEIRFPAADVEMDHDSIVEFPAFWPDRPPLPNITYEAHVVTGDSNISSDTSIWLNIFGDYGDVSYRRLQAVANESDQPLFSADSTCIFDFEAVSIGVLKTAEITVECKDKGEFLWECTQLIVSGSLNGQSYVFQFPRAFTAQNNRQNASVTLL